MRATLEMGHRTADYVLGVVNVWSGPLSKNKLPFHDTKDEITEYIRSEIDADYLSEFSRLQTSQNACVPRKLLTCIYRNHKSRLDCAVPPAGMHNYHLMECVIFLDSESLSKVVARVLSQSIIFGEVTFGYPTGVNKFNQRRGSGIDCTPKVHSNRGFMAH
ncbi:hypothetical protein T265_11660 [Opisthorchis viverrini]|uniref:Uncharacterized protein n=1 Tax=Opisthorchis viverrini TaxID=6198 RepID=A0A074Z288_OPIVI|nr:hypothetical protein T265_11660 [Opisthorchis viverrini]KER19617.1 hypothetical protein T265_11660 [Opisthorchis viverrini]